MNLPMMKLKLSPDLFEKIEALAGERGLSFEGAIIYMLQKSVSPQVSDSSLGCQQPPDSPNDDLPLP
jgi:hypothetical protein